MRPVKITFEGRTLTASQWSKETGIPRKTILGRLDGGWTVDDVLKPVGYLRTYKYPATLTYNGQTKTLSQWSKITGINASTIRARIRSKVPMDQILLPKSEITRKARKCSILPYGMKDETREKIFASERVYRGPAPNTFPLTSSFESTLTKENYEYHFAFLRKALRKDRWLKLKESLGKEYLEDLRKQCHYMIAA
jgi:hypothetical protein